MHHSLLIISIKRWKGGDRNIVKNLTLNSKEKRARVVIIPETSTFCQVGNHDNLLLLCRVVTLQPLMNVIGILGLNSRIESIFKKDQQNTLN